MRQAARHIIGLVVGAACAVAASAVQAAPAKLFEPGSETRLPIVNVQCGQSVPCPGGEFAPGGPGYGGPSGPLGAVGVGQTGPWQNTYVEVDGRLLDTGVTLRRRPNVLIGQDVEIGRNVLINGSDHASWCSARYRSYDPASDTYMSYSGQRRRCLR